MDRIVQLVSHAGVLVALTETGEVWTLEPSALNPRPAILYRSGWARETGRESR